MTTIAEQSNGVSSSSVAPGIAEFQLVSDLSPAGDQPEAIAKLVDGLHQGLRYQTLLGITGSGKSFTIANVIATSGRPALVLAPNKSLAAQLSAELAELFPENHVEFFVSYYDYYQPEAYIASSDTFIEKDSAINEQIDRLRHSATTSARSAHDVIVVASVSAIYGLGAPETYESQRLDLAVGAEMDTRAVLRNLVDLGYLRNDTAPVRGRFRVRGDTLDIFPASSEQMLRVEFFGDEIEHLTVLNPVTGEVLDRLQEASVYPASHYSTDAERLTAAIEGIEVELTGCLADLKADGKLLEAQRLGQRTRADIEMMTQTGACSGIENYSRYLDGRNAGEAPFTLLDYMPSDFICIVDESHVTVPQLNGQWAGDRSRKATLIEHGFRLPSAADNRPLRFAEFSERVGQVVFMSATPGPYEREVSDQIVELLVRPTGLIDPEIVVRSTEGQIDDLLAEVRATTAQGHRTLITTLTKKMAEALSDYLLEQGIRVRFLHSDVDTFGRIELLRGLRQGAFDALVGVNLLREGLDLPEVALVAILDADKSGFLRSETALMQTVGRAARNAAGRVIMYANERTPAMEAAIAETDRRRARQLIYNKEHGITPRSIHKAVYDILSQHPETIAEVKTLLQRDDIEAEDLDTLLAEMRNQMHDAAGDLRFEEAARLRDEIRVLEREAAAGPVASAASGK